MINRLALLKLYKQAKQLIYINIALLLLYSYAPTAISTSPSGNVMKKLKCDNGAGIYPNSYKSWHYNNEDLIEIYPNGYRRVYDIKFIDAEKILADEDAASGMHYVNINFNDKSIDVKVSTPLVKYIDKNCKKISP